MDKSAAIKLARDATNLAPGNRMGLISGARAGGTDAVPMPTRSAPRAMPLAELNATSGPGTKGLRRFLDPVQQREWLEGAAIDEAKRVTPERVVQHLALPPEREYVAAMVVEAGLKAIDDSNH